MDTDPTETSAYGEVLMFALVPLIVGVLIIASWALSFFPIVPYYVSGGIALVALLVCGEGMIFYPVVNCDGLVKV